MHSDWSSGFARATLDAMVTSLLIRGTEMHGPMTRRLHELEERQRELQKLAQKAIETGKPVFMGEWGPSGHSLYITAKPKEPPSTGGER